MKKTVMKKTVLLLLPVLMLCLCACSGTSGSVSVAAGGEEHQALSFWIFSLKGNVASDGARKQPADVAEQLNAIAWTDDLQVNITGKTTGQVSYSLYDGAFERVYYNMAELQLPEAPGEYILCVEVAWGTQTRYDGYQNFFMLVR